MRGRLVVITGSGRGIGRAIAQECARNGARLILASRTLAELEQSAALVRKAEPGAVVTIAQCDVSSREQVQDLFAKARHEHGPVFAVVCAAGILGEPGLLEDSNLAVWEKTIQINLLGSVYCAHYAIPQMKQLGEGRLVFFSGGGQGPQARRTAYVASKGAIWRLTESLGAELLESKIYVNAIAPGPVNTKFLEDLLLAGEKRVGKAEYQNALQQKADGGTAPDFAARLTTWLLSDESRGLSGKVLSARWDDFRSFRELPALTSSDIFTFKRVIDLRGNTRAK